MRYELWIGLRYLAAKRREKFISIISLISVLGVAVGVTALIVVLAVMSGFDQDLKDRIVGTNAHIIVEHEEGINNAAQIIEELKQIPHILDGAPFVNGQVMVKYQEMAVGVLLKGIDPIREMSVTKIAQYLIQGDLVFGVNGIVIGKELANKLNIGLGKELSVVSPMDGRVHDFRVSGIFGSGMYDYDMNLVFVDLKSAQEIFNTQGLVSGIGLRIDNVYLANSLKREIQSRLGFRWWVRSWMDLNKNLFAALKLEKVTMFIILALIVVVACFNIGSTLIMVVMEKTKDIGILKSIGATRRSISAIFMGQGFIIGLIGTMIGAIAGFLLCHLLKTYQFIKLPKDIYYIDRLPVELQWTDSIIIISASIIISWLSTLYPAWQASKLDPVDALRYE